MKNRNRSAGTVLVVVLATCVWPTYVLSVSVFRVRFRLSTLRHAQECHFGRSRRRRTGAPRFPAHPPGVCGVRVLRVRWKPNDTQNARTAPQQTHARAHARQGVYDNNAVTMSVCERVRRTARYRGYGGTTAAVERDAGWKRTPEFVSEARPKSRRGRRGVGFVFAAHCFVACVRFDGFTGRRVATVSERRRRRLRRRFILPATLFRESGRTISDRSVIDDETVFERAIFFQCVSGGGSEGDFTRTFYRPS